MIVRKMDHWYLSKYNSLIRYHETRYRKHSQISWNLSLAAQILQKNFVQRNQKKYEVESLALLQMCMR